MQFQRFLEFGNFYQKFIQDYRKIVAPLTALTSCKVPFQWSVKAEQAFQTLKTRSTTAPLLQTPDPAHSFVVDASSGGVGGILSQRSVNDHKLHPCFLFYDTMALVTRN